MSEPIDLSHTGEDGSHHHMQLDQEVFEAFMAQKHFRCTECRRRYIIDKLAGLMVNGVKLHGICEGCEHRYKQIEVAGLN